MHWWTRLWVAFSLGFVIALSGCGGGGSASQGPVAPSIDTQPVSLSVVEGSSATFSVLASSDKPILYQWQRDGTAIVGADAASFSISSVTLADSGAQFRVIVSNTAGSVTSSQVSLTVTPLTTAPTIVSQPSGFAVLPGTPVTFHVEADGTAPLAFQWQRDGVNISGANSADYTLASPQLSDSGASFGVVVSNSAGAVSSVNALLTVDTVLVPPSIVTQPQSVTVLDGSSATLSVAASGTGPLGYQWRRDGQILISESRNTLATPALTPSDSGAVYSVVVSNGAGRETSADAAVTVNYRPVNWSVQPASTSVAQGQAANFAVQVTGSQPITYQWQRNGSDLIGATGPTFTTPATTLADDGAQYRVVVTNPNHSVVSDAAVLTVQAAALAPAIATAPSDLSVSEGQTASFTVTATGTAPLTYQWLRNGAAISGATTTSYTTGIVSIADNAANFSVRVTNVAGSVTSPAAALTVLPPTGGLVGRAWTSGQLLEINDNRVIDRVSAIDDEGRVTVVFRKNNGTRDVIYATRGTPNTNGVAPTWSEPVVIDVLAGAGVSTMGTQPIWNLAVSPGGNALVWWYHRAPCTTSTYSISSTCRYHYFSRFSSANAAWTTPEFFGDQPGDDFQGVINDRGDVALFGTSWIRSGTNRYFEAPALFSRGAAQSGLTRQLVNSVPLSDANLQMDAAGNLLLTAEAEQNATTDLVAYRGTAATGLGAQEVLDTRGSAAAFMTARVGVNGQQVVVWEQNNGTATTVWAATSLTATGSWARQDLGELRTFGVEALTVADNGDALLLNRYEGWRRGWNGTTWAALSDLPTNRPTSVFLYCSHARNGNFLCIAGDAFGEGNTGRWATYDATRNVMVQPLTSNTQGYALGVTTMNKSVGYEEPPAGSTSALLSVNGVGVTTLLNAYDTLPSQTSPAGDTRTVKNLWGIYLK